MTSPSNSGRQLSRRQFDEVMRRAAELAAKEGDSGDSDLSESEVFRIAGEVGLAEQHVRRALAEVGTSTASEGLLADRLIGPSTVIASRVIAASGDELADTLDQFLVGGRLLQRVRRSAKHLQFRPAVDWISQFARAASGTSRRYFVASARSVEITLDPLDDGRTVVTFLVDPGIRGDYIAGAIGGGGSVGASAGVGSGLMLATTAGASLEVALAAGLAVGTGVIVTAFRMAARGHRRKLDDVTSEVEGILDALEAGHPLEPPPKSWLRRVEDHFHGARRLLDS